MSEIRASAYTPPAALQRYLAGPRAVWQLSGVVAALAAFLTLTLRDLGPAADAVTLRWWMLAPAFYLAELAVVHIKFRKDAHSFSMSEIPLVVGLFFAAPVDLVMGQLLGNLVVLTVNRRQPALKLVFNLAQFALQSTVGIVLFRWAVGGSGVGPEAWLGALTAAVVGLFIADVLINGAIHLTGGTISRKDIFNVFGVSFAAAVMNTSLGLTAATLLNSDPAAAWLALVPPAVLYVAYRAYTSQQRERSRLESLFEMTRELHGRPQLEAALLSAAHHARTMIDAEYVEIVLLPEGEGGQALVTRSGPADHRVVLQPAEFSGDHRVLAEAAQGRLVTGTVERLTTQSPNVPIDAGIASGLVSGDELIGVVIAVNKLGDIGPFTTEDLKLLESIGHQVTVSIENSQLEDSLAQLTELKNQLEALVRSKDDFVASVSHELRTPLTAVVGLAHELREQTAGSNEELGEFIEIIAEQSGELANLVEDLLVAARVDTGNVTVVPTDLDVAAELRAVIAGFPTKGKDVSLSVAPGLTVRADATRLRQIVRNLVTNAHRYGGSDIRVEASSLGESTQVCVSDDGQGVPVGMEDSIFGRYERAAAGAPQPGSVGLGLAVSRQLAGLMGGSLVYRRAADRTEFLLTLPATA